MPGSIHRYDIQGTSAPPNVILLRGKFEAGCIVLMYISDSVYSQVYKNALQGISNSASGETLAQLASPHPPASQKTDYS